MMPRHTSAEAQLMKMGASWVSTVFATLLLSPRRVTRSPAERCPKNSMGRCIRCHMYDAEPTVQSLPSVRRV